MANSIKFGGDWDEIHLMRISGRMTRRRLRGEKLRPHGIHGSEHNNASGELNVLCGLTEDRIAYCNTSMISSMHFLRGKEKRGK